MSDKAPDKIPNNMPNNTSNNTPISTSNNTPNNIPNSTVNHMSNKTPLQKPDKNAPVHINVLRTGRPDEAQRAGLARLADTCRALDHSHLSMPEDADLYYMAYGADDLLASAAALTFYPEAPGGGADVLYAECSAFTRPDLRRMGYFSAVFDVLSQDIEDTDLYFLTDGVQKGAMAALRSLGAVHDRDEYMMERTLNCAREQSGAPAAVFSFEGADSASAARIPQLTVRVDLLPEEADEEEVKSVRLTFYLADGKAPAAGPAGNCRLIFCGDGVCFCGFEIAEPLRGRGLGKAALLLTLSLLESRKGADGAQRNGDSGRDSGFCGLLPLCLPQAGRMFLHVSGDNQAAVSLYKKTGFRISETLSYYLY